MKPTDCWTKVILVTGVATTAAAVLWATGLQVKGHSLGFWVSQLDKPQAKQARAALTSLGPTSISLLLNQVRPQPDRHSLDRLHGKIWWSLPPSLRNHLRAPRPPEWILRPKISAAISAMGPSAVPGLCLALKDPDCNVRWVAVDAVTTMGRSADAAVPDLVRLLDRKDCDLNREVVRGLCGMGPKSRIAVPRLILLLKDSPGPELEPQIEFFLRGPWAEAERVVGSTVPALKQLLNDANPRVRLEAASALWRINYDPEMLGFLGAELQKVGDSGQRVQDPAVGRRLSAIQDRLFGPAGI